MQTGDAKNQQPSLAFSYIRMSSGQQLKGDSLRRQLKLSEDYAAEHNLRLDTEFKVDDLCAERDKLVGEQRVKYLGTDKIIRGAQRRGL